MKPQTFFILFSFILLALALIPFAAAQEGNMLTDAFSNFGSWITDVTAPATEYVTTHVGETATIATTGGAAIGLGAAYTKLKSGFNVLKDKLTGAESDVSKVTEQLSSYKSQAETQLTTLQTDAAKQIEAAKTQAQNATSQLGGLQDKVTDLTQQKASLQNEKERLEQLVHDWQVKYEAVCPKVK